MKWKVADSTFKLMDKFGYLGIMRAYKQALNSGIQPDQFPKLAEWLLGKMKETTMKALNDSEYSISLDESQVDESGDTIKAAVLAALLAIPGVCGAEQIKPALNSKQPLAAVEQVRAKASPKASYSGYSYSHATNIVALTLFWEAQNQGKEGIDRVASVLLNRCDGDEKKLPLACLKNAYSSKAKRYVWQFSCWDEKGIHKIQRSTQRPGNYRIFIPREVKAGKQASIDVWKYCNEVAVKLCDGKFKTLGDWTEYYNPARVTPTWADELTSVETFGNHKFGILKRHAAYT